MAKGNQKIAKEDIGKLLQKWRQEFTILAPSQDGDTAKMAEWEGQDTGFLERYRNTVVPPKAHFFPPVEEMFRFHKDEGGYRLEATAPDGRKQLLFGIRPCDANALAILDRVFQEGYEDPYYLARRKNTLLVGLTCTSPGESCFCTSMGSGPADATNVDLLLTDIGDAFLAEGVTAAGRGLLDRTGELKETTVADDARAQEAKEASRQRVTRTLDTGAIDQRLLRSFEDEDYWEKVAAKCISCGVCTLLCPTCFCFDINDELVKQQGTRFRSWDSCGFPVYTQMPMENPREEKWRRVRQKVSHKFEFYPMSFGVIACTGCGRCVRLCPVNWDITQVLASLPATAEAKKEN